MPIYTFNVPAILAFDIDAINETEAKAIALVEHRVFTQDGGNDLTQLASPYVSTKYEDVPELVDTYIED